MPKENKQQHVASHDPLAAAVHDFGSVIESLMAQGEEIYEKAKRFEQYMVAVRPDEDLDPNAIHLIFTFERDGVTSDFRFPVYKNLRDKELELQDQVIAARANEHPSIQRSYTTKFTSLISKPSSMFVIGIATILNIVSLAARFSKAGIARRLALTSLSPWLQVGAIGFAMLYFVPITVYLYTKNTIREEIKKIFALADDYIARGLYLSADNMITNLSFLQECYLSPNTPGNEDLRWKYLYLQACFVADRRVGIQGGKMRSFKRLTAEALELSATDDQKFQILKLLINESESVRKITYVEVASKYYNTPGEREGLLEQAQQRHWERIKDYVKQIPTQCKMHIDLARTLHQGLHATLNLVDAGNFRDAIPMFNSIEWNSYCKISFPAAAVMYYQLETILTLVKKDLRGPITYKNSCFPTDLSLARKNLDKVQKYMENHFSYLAGDHKKHVDSFKESYRVLCTEAVPEPETSPELNTDKRVPKNMFSVKGCIFYFPERTSDNISLPDIPEEQDSYPDYRMPSFSI